jgi:hypothetical protein
MSVEERLQAYTVTLDRATELRRSGTVEPSRGSPTPNHAARRQRSRVIVGCALVAALAVAAFTLVAVGRSDRRSITPQSPTSARAEGSVTTDVESSEPPLGSQGGESTAGTQPSAPPPTVPASTVPSSPSVDLDGVGLATLGGQAGPVAFSVIPDGYRVVAAYVDSSSPPVSEQTVPTAADGWSATYLRRPSSEDALAPFVSVIIEDITNNDPYWGYPDTLTGSDVAVGSFSGRFDYSYGSGYVSFIARVNDTQHVVISGRATIDDITTVAQGLQLSSDGVTARATTLPQGFELVDQGSRSRQLSYGGTWTVSYAKGQLGETLISVRAVSHPRDPAVMRLLGPTPSRFVDIDGYEGVLNTQGLAFDVSPTFQIQLAHDSPSGPPTSVNDDLVELARTIVAITEQQFAELHTAAAADPLTATDMPCGFYVNIDNIRSADPAATTDEQGVLVVPAGATVTVDLSSTQPLGTVTFGLTEDTPPDPNHSTDLRNVTIATLDQLDQPTSIQLTWDGTIDGTPAPPGTYTVSYGAAASSNPSPGSCNGTLNFGASTGIRLVVP